MDILPNARPRGDLKSVARWAAASVPAGLSARHRSVRVMAAALIPLCVALPLIGAWPVTVGAVALAVLLRLAALIHVLRDIRAADLPAPTVLPPITILLPLREEAPIVADLVAGIRRLDYPTNLVEVIALVEADDRSTLAALCRSAPRSWTVIALPDGHPRTKPRACNVGLALACGPAHRVGIALKFVGLAV